ncbi:MAG: MlaD family protein [Geitlerinemataceae cyanobacterium]
MRSRTLREGSLGLFIVIGLALFAVSGLWLRGFQAGRRSYSFIAEFDRVAGIQAGASVRYRGVSVGRVEAIRPGPNGVDIIIEIASSDLLLPKGVKIEVNQGGFIGETAVDILPVDEALSEPTAIAKPIANNCDPGTIICDGDRLRGELGVSFDQLTRASLEFTRAFSNPEFLADLQTLLQSTSGATTEIAKLASEISELTESFEGEFGLLSASALSTTDSVGRAVDSIDGTVVRVNQLIDTVDGLVADNRGNLVNTLDSVSRLSGELSMSAAALRPVLEETGATLSTVNATLTEFDRTSVVADVEALISSAVVLADSAAATSENLRVISSTINDPDTLLQLQFTLDSARMVFENVEKITSDLDDLTGDPAFREDMRRLVDGLSSLVSMTQQLDRQTQLAHTLPRLTEDFRGLQPLDPARELAPLAPEVAP